MKPANQGRFEFAWGALVCAALAVAFLWTPITRLGTETLSPADVRPRSEISRSPATSADAAERRYAAYLFDREHVLRGELPLWNSRAGFGSPHLADPSSAVFSPLTALYHVFPLALAALLAAFTKLFLLGFFTFAFLRRLALTPVACLFGATVFMFSGHNIVYLGHPQSAVAIALPAGLWAIERLARRFERDAPEDADPWRLIHPSHSFTFALVFAFGLVAGDLQSFAFTVLAWLVYGGARVSTLGVRDAGRAVVVVACLIALVVGACAVFLLPAIEYLRESWILCERLAGGLRPLPTGSWPVMMFPKLAGSADLASFATGHGGAFGFTSALSTGAGATALFLALVAPFVIRTRRVLIPFLVMAAAWIVYAYDLFGVQTLFELVPALGLADVERSQPLFHVAIAVCAAFTVHHFIERRPETNVVGAAALAAAAVVLLFVFRAGASQLVLDTWNVGDVARDASAAAAGTHVATVTTWFFVGVVAIAVAWLTRDRRLRLAAALACTVVVLMQQALPFVDVNATVPDADLFARTATDADLARLTSEKRSVFLGSSPQSSTGASHQGGDTIASGDGIGIARYERLRRTLFACDTTGERSDWASTRGLELFGIERVLDRDPWIDVNTWTGFVAPDPAQEFLTRPIAPDAGVEFDFACFAPRTSSIRLCFATGGHALRQTIEIVLADRVTGERIATRSLVPGFGPESGAEREYVELGFEESHGSVTRPLRLSVQSEDGLPGTAWSLVARRDWEWWMNVGLWRRDGVHAVRYDLIHPEFRDFATRQNGVALRGAIIIDAGAVAHVFHESGRVGPFRVLDANDPLPPFHTVTRAWVAVDENDALAAVQRAVFDPRQIVVLEGVDASVDRGAQVRPDVNESVEVVAREERTVRLRTSRVAPGWLVAALPWYPGWRARVNGVERPILRANYAFGAVAIGAGTSEVVLTYEPSSVRIGTWLSLACVLALVVWFWRSRRAAHLSRAAR